MKRISFFMLAMAAAHMAVPDVVVLHRPHNIALAETRMVRAGSAIISAWWSRLLRAIAAMTCRQVSLWRTQIKRECRRSARQNLDTLSRTGRLPLRDENGDIVTRYGGAAEFAEPNVARSTAEEALRAHGSEGERSQPECIAGTQRRLSKAGPFTELAPVTEATSLGLLTASIAHEVNQPLAAIITNGEASLRWLARPVPDVEEVRELTRRVVADARRASEIIDRIRAMVSRRAPEQTPLSLDDVIQEALTFLGQEFQSMSTCVSVDLAAALPRVVGDRTQLQQVIVNLAMNAVQAMVQSGTGRRSIAIRTILLDPETVCCSIEDSGPGIEAAHMPRLFDAFFTTKTTGMGMGLLISRSIIEAHGGRIAADNESAHGGARFTFTLPVIARISEGCCYSR